MKKLSLKNLKLDANDLLQREQLKNVFGGYGGYGVYGDCEDDCTSDSGCTGEKVCIALKPKVCAPDSVNRCIYPPLQ